MYRRRITLAPTLDESARPGTVRILMPASDPASTGGPPSGRAPATMPNVVGLSSADAREALSRAGFGIAVKYVESKSDKALVEAQSPPSVDAQNRRVVEVQVGLRASLYLYYTGADAKVANDLAAHLRESFGERLALVRSIERSPSEMAEGDMPFSGAGFEGVAMLVARAASARLSQMLRRQITVRPTLDERIRPGTLRILVPGREAASTGGTPSAHPAAAAPNVVGQPLAAARELLTRAGFDVGHKYIEGNPRARPEERGVVIEQRVSERAGRSGRPLVLLDIIVTATVVILYGRDDEQQVADELAQHLRQWLADPQYLIKTVKSGRADAQRGEVHDNGAALDGLATKIVSGASSWLDRRYGARVALRRVLQNRMAPTAVILTLPDTKTAERR